MTQQRQISARAFRPNASPGLTLPIRLCWAHVGPLGRPRAIQDTLFWLKPLLEFLQEPPRAVLEHFFWLSELESSKNVDVANLL